ncbi:MAG: DNA cytosine methyltransferase [Candidatus Bathyarchaeota archaeon]|nr:DNA cytosine methyltransferase [Candidatus Bathyarchaeota archaeon]
MSERTCKLAGWVPQVKPGCEAELEAARQLIREVVFGLWHLMTQKLCIDLCCGLKGSSAAFANDSNWEVVTVDIERKFKPTIVADVRYLPLKENLNPTLLLASPPCQHFSLANPKWPKCGIKLAMEIVGACFEAVATLKPKYWLIENPRGRLRKLSPITPNMTIFYSDYDREYPCQKPTDLWTNIPLKMVPHQRRPYSGRNGHLFDRMIGRDPSERAKVPRGVSEAFKASVEGIQ